MLSPSLQLLLRKHEDFHRFHISLGFFDVTNSFVFSMRWIHVNFKFLGRFNDPEYLVKLDRGARSCELEDLLLSANVPPSE